MYNSIEKELKKKSVIQHNIEYFLINLPESLKRNKEKGLMKTLADTPVIEYFENLTI